MSRWIGGVLLLFCALSVSAKPDRPASFKAQDWAAAREYLTEYVEEVVDDEDVSGLSIAVVNGTQTVWERGFSYADVEEKIAANENTIYQVGGMSAVATAMAVLKLAEKKLIDLDAPITTYLPDFKIQRISQTQSVITPRNLLTHHSGLPLSVFKGAWSSSPVSLREFVAQLGNEYAAYAPDTVYAHSNAGYSVLGLLVETVSKRPFAEFVANEVLKPLNMLSSDFVLNPTIQRRLAKGYKDGEEKKLLAARDVSALGMYSSVHDLAQILKAYYLEQSKVLSRERLTSMIEPQNGNSALNFGRRTGFAWLMVGEPMLGGGEVVQVNGSTMLFRSRMTLLPQHRFGVVVLANSSNAFRAIDLVTKEILAVMLEMKTGIRQPDNDENMPISLRKLSPSTDLKSEYTTLIGYIPVARAKSDNVADVMGWDIRLLPRTDGWREVEYDLFGFIPLKLDWVAETRIGAVEVDGKNILLANIQRREQYFGMELSAPKLIPSWRSRIGTYRLAERDEFTNHYEIGTGELLERNGRLLFAYTLPWKISLEAKVAITPVNDDLAVIEGLGTGYNEVIQARLRNGKTYLRYSGYDLEKID